MVLRTSSISIFVLIPSAGDNIIICPPSIGPIDLYAGGFGKAIPNQ